MNPTYHSKHRSILVVLGILVLVVFSVLIYQYLGVQSNEKKSTRFTPLGNEEKTRLVSGTSSVLNANQKVQIIKNGTGTSTPLEEKEKADIISIINNI